ncbi:MAG TPA: hypothetical protein VN698_03415 [Bacteroidia bacterium]|nr:hypothetical protein [Bacteroidia bacterium]
MKKYILLLFLMLNGCASIQNITSKVDDKADPLIEYAEKAFSKYKQLKTIYILALGMI